MSQRKAAALAGMDSGGLSKIEGGKQGLMVETLDRLLLVYGASLTDLHEAMGGSLPASGSRPPSTDREAVRLAAIEAIERIAQIANFASSGDNALRSGDREGRANGKPVPVRREDD